jgi:hypothetical protein
MPIGVIAQVFPVTVTPQIIPPYSLRLSEYSTSISEKLVLNLLLTDVNEFNVQVRLKLYIESNTGVAIQSSDVVVGASPIFLDGGTLLRLTNLDLQPYFNLQNLQGVTPQQYSTTLPEGLYRFCFEVYDVIKGKRISRKSCATVYLVLNDPPFLNIPNKGEQVVIRDPQNIIFQWTPRHLNATNVSYEFTLAELWDTQMDPQAAFLASRPLYQTTTFSNTLLYGPAETPLLPDKNYTWRVRAIVSDGISESSVFKNNGYSEIYHFTYTGVCAEPQYVLAEGQNPTKEKILWQGVDHKRYSVQYRKKGVENSRWFEEETQNPYATINSLAPGTTYEFRVGGQCVDNGGFTYSQIYEFTTQISAQETATYNCGITPEIVITNQEPLQELLNGDVFTAGDFPVTIMELSPMSSTPQEGRYSGWGYIVVPYLMDTRLKVIFDNIQINTEYQLIQGTVYTDYDPTWSGVDDISDELDLLVNSFGQLLDAWKELTSSYKDIRENGDQYTEEEWQETTSNYNTTLQSTEAYVEQLQEEGVIDATTAQEIKEQLNSSKEDWTAMEECYSGDSNEKENDPDKGGIVEDCATYNRSAEGASNQAISQIKEIEAYKKEREEKIYQILLALEATGGNGFIKCKKCDDTTQNTTTQLPDSPNIISFKAIQFKSKDYVRCILGAYDKENTENPLQFDKYTLDTEINEEVKASLSDELKTFNNALKNKEEVLAITNSDTESITICNTTLSFTNFCNTSNEVSEEEKQDLANELPNCLETTQGAVQTLDQITTLLNSASNQIRSNQRISFEQNGKVYELNAQDIAEINSTALTNEQINAGEWSNSNVDVMMRLSNDSSRNLQFSALGMYQGITNSNGTPLDISKINTQLREQTNIVLKQYEIRDPLTTLNDIGADFDSDYFPDEKKIEIDKETGFMKLVSEGLGVATVFAKTTEIEQAVYTSYGTGNTDQVIKAPPVLTGATEAGGKKVTELTSMVVMVYDLTFDKEIRKQTVDGFIKIRHQIKDDPKKLFPLLKEALIEEATGSDSGTLSEADITTARGQHITSKASVSVVMTVIAGSKFLLELPEIAAKIATKLSKADLLKLVKEGSEQLTNKIDELGELKGKFLEDLIVMKEDIAKFIENPDLVDAWKVVSNGKASLRSLDNINAIDAFKKANPNITDQALQAAFESIKSSGSRRQAFVDALKSCTDNTSLIGSLKKSRLASIEEIRDALNKMRNYKTGKPQVGNLGYLEGDIPNAIIDKNKFWESVSKAEAQLETHIFDAIEATGSSGSWVRITDSEYRMLNDLAKKLKGVKGQVNDKITGTLKIVSENPYCTSCQGVIQQFSNMFPNIEITLIDGVK